MSRSVGTSLLSLIAWGLTGMGAGQAQTLPKGVAPPGQAGATTPAIPGLNDVVATVTTQNRTDKVTKGEVLNYLSRNPLPAPEDRDAAYHVAVDVLINTALLNQYLARQNVPVPPAKVDEAIQRMEQQLKSQGQDLATTIRQSDTSMDEIRKVFENRIRWQEFVNSRATDAVLRKFLADHRDLFSGTQVRASHILLKCDPNASAAEKEKIKQKLLAIRTDIIHGKITFAEAANKYSEDPATSGGAGGDLDYFTLDSGFLEEFAHAAFRLRKGEISQPVETPLGWHLIQITDRKDGKLPDFEQYRMYILTQYGNELQKNILSAERKTAKIEVKPMPKDLFPPEQPAAAAVGAAAGGTTAAPKDAATPAPKP
ncbi:MAG TPA: peptidylprolyl isomerase [Isosphaeraceae bacterium]|nr:peptidylprolyl isomerase [Isosphaeraceae bacterium]